VTLALVTLRGVDDEGEGEEENEGESGV